jgi:hypothetical protein
MALVNSEASSPGIFLDLDLQCLRPLDPLRRFNFVAVAANPMGISNGFLMASPQHAFLKNVVQNLPRYNINWLGLPYATVMFSTGCHFLSYDSISFSMPFQHFTRVSSILTPTHSEQCMPCFRTGTISVSYGARIIFTDSPAPLQLHYSDIWACRPGILSMGLCLHLRCLFLSFSWHLLLARQFLQC